MQQSVHLSIDDVELLFLDLIANSANYKSAFESPFLKYLQRLHVRFNAAFTLFGYTYLNGHSISEIPVRFKKELQANASWLKFGFHWISSDRYDPDTPDDLVAKACGEFYTAVREFASEENISDYIRLHYFHPSPTLTEKLAALPQWRPDTTFLCSDSKNRASYDLTDSECLSLQEKRVITKSGRKYIPTDIRIETHDGNLSHLMDYPFLTVFTHEWALCNDIDKQKSRSLKGRLAIRYHIFKNRRKWNRLIRQLNRNKCRFL